MLFNETYKQAMKAPTAKGGRGWKYAGDASTQATLAFSLGVKWCINADAIYDWANRHDVRLFDERKKLHDTADLLLVAVLNDWSIERTERELAGARGR
jgi:hypothetical protein